MFIKHDLQHIIIIKYKHFSKKISYDFSGIHGANRRIARCDSDFAGLSAAVITVLHHLCYRQHASGSDYFPVRSKGSCLGM